MNSRFAGDIWSQFKDKEISPMYEMDPGFSSNNPGPEIDRGLDPGFYIPQPFSISEMFGQDFFAEKNIPSRHPINNPWGIGRDEIERIYNPITGREEPRNRRSLILNYSKPGSEIDRGFDLGFYKPQPFSISEMFVDPKRGFSNIPNKDRYLLQGTFVDPKRGFSPPIDEIPKRYDPRTGQFEPINKGSFWSY